jgi:hypothetical protein
MTVANGAHTLAAVASDAAGNTATSGISVTVNNPVSPPVISGVSATSITASGATINWSTDQASSSQVVYGTTSGYGSSSALNQTLVTSHSVNLSGLTPSATYHYQVQSKNAQGLLATSTDFTFTTATPSAGLATWTELFNTTFQNVCPPNNFQPPGGGMPAYNFSDACRGKITSWSSGAVDIKRNRLLLWGGGHDNYIGNEVYSLDMTMKSSTALCTGPNPCETNSTVPAVRRLMDPAIFTLYSGDCYASPFPAYPTMYAGPSPVTTHTFGNLVYLPKADKLFTWNGPDKAGCQQYFHVWLLNLAILDSGSGEPWEEHNPGGFNVAGITPGGDIPFSFCSLDLTTVNESVVCLWGNLGAAVRYDSVADTWALISSNNWSIPSAPTVVFDPDRNLVYAFGPDYLNTSGSGRINVWDPQKPTVMTDITASVTGCDALIAYPYPSVVWDPRLHRVVGYVPSDATVNITVPNNQVFIYDPATKTCVKQPQSGGPTADFSNYLNGGNHGAFLHFNYIPAIGEYVWILNPEGDAYTFTLNTSLSATAGAQQSTLRNTTFPTALQATLTDAANNPLSGLTITFTAPANGASGSFGGLATATAVTDSHGVATAPPLMANSQAGSYAVTATGPGVITVAKFSLTNQ